MKRLRTVLWQGTLPVVLVAGWWFWSEANATFFFPRLSEILQAFSEEWVFERVGSDVVPSLGRLAIGFGIAIVLGVAAGMVLGRSRLAYRAALPIVEFLRALPPPALIPFGLLVFGLGNTMKIVVIASGSVWPILLNTIQGVRSIEPTFDDVARVYKLGRAEHFLGVTLPAASPQIFAGLRSSLSIAVILMVISEMVAATNGVGFFVVQAQRSFAIDEMWSGILLLGLLGCLLNAALVLVERKVLAWHHGARASALAQPAESRRRQGASGATATAPAPPAASPSVLTEVR